MKFHVEHQHQHGDDQPERRREREPQVAQRVAQHLPLCAEQRGEIIVEQPHLEDGRLHRALGGGETALVGGQLERDEDGDSRDQRQHDEAGHGRQRVDRRHRQIEGRVSAGSARQVDDYEMYPGPSVAS